MIDRAVGLIGALSGMGLVLLWSIRAAATPALGLPQWFNAVIFLFAGLNMARMIWRGRDA